MCISCIVVYRLATQSSTYPSDDILINNDIFLESDLGNFLGGDSVSKDKVFHLNPINFFLNVESIVHLYTLTQSPFLGDCLREVRFSFSYENIHSTIRIKNLSMQPVLIFTIYNKIGIIMMVPTKKNLS